MVLYFGFVEAGMLCRYRGCIAPDLAWRKCKNARHPIAPQLPLSPPAIGSNPIRLTAAVNKRQTTDVF